MEKLRAIWKGRAQLGEGPVWSRQLRHVLFVDLIAGRLIAWSPEGGRAREWRVPETVCWLVERADGDGFIAGLKHRIVHLRLDLDRGPDIVATLAAPEADLPGNRFNDGKADPFGNIWFGSMDEGEGTVSGSLWRMDAGGKVARIDGGYGVANGPAISPDGRTLYHSDSPVRVVYAFDLAPDGSLANKRAHIRFSTEAGFPDGMACDAEGGLWIAHFNGGRITRHLPDGSIERSIPLPCACVSSLCFFGDRLDRLAITTGALGRRKPGLLRSLLKGPDLAGSLFIVEPGIGGAPTGRWGML